MVGQKYIDRVNNEILPFRPNDQGEYVSRFKNAVTKVMKDLDNEEKKVVEGLVETWNKQGPPPEFQLK